jgi:hypothetical protein
MDNKKMTIEEASKRWIKQGLDFKNNLNDWLDIIYIHGEKPTTECPTETRQDLADFVLEKLIEFNKNGKADEFRKLFPPDYDPFNWEKINPTCISQVAILDDNRIVATVNEWHQPRFVYVIKNDEFDSPDGIICFGKSFDKKYFAKVYADRIEVSENWDGKIISTHYPPTNYGQQLKDKYPDLKYILEDNNFETLEIQSINVASDGQKVYIGCEPGIFELHGKEFYFFDSENSLDNIEDDEDFDASEPFGITLDYPHIDISPDSEYVVVGSQSSSHLIYKKNNDKWEVTANIEPRSEYPSFAKFNYRIKDQGGENDGIQVLLCSCHFSKSASIALPINNIKPNLNLSGYDADPELNYINDSKWVFSAGLYPWGYALGANDGYIWFNSYYGHLYGYLHVGGTVMDIDYSSDRTKMIVASHSGQIIIFNWTELYSNNSIFRNKYSKNENDSRKDPFAITNTFYVDEKRYLFLSNQDPLIW